MSATVRELVDEAYDRRESTWRAALETVNDWVESVRTPSPLLSGDRVRVVEGRIKDRMRTGEKLRRKLADSNDEIHESVEVENQVIDVVGARVVCRTEREQTALWDLLTEGDDTNLSIAEVRDYSATPKPSGYRGRHLIVEVPFEAEPSVLVELQLRTILQDAWCVLAEEHLFKPGQALKSDPQQERLSVILSGLLAQADSVAGYIADDVGAYLGLGNAAPLRSFAEVEEPTDPAIEVTIRELNHSYVLAADEVGRHGIIRLETLGLTPDNPERSAFPHPGDKLQVRMDESNTTRYFIPVSREG
ncbi:RelA/SpoT domain-containing protein [Brevibacterium sp. SMBL_HHYL_HB1]|uniref:GTP pyrophosphokinase n=1 Tax=Brevibacterium sp. SMBL_HHYL_HB1 TaxID=2777556 RepID=UPI001BA4CAAF|nr:RelA/SpoT domain-containing protein [Brevibacterium sp. SMBL_HHYL_HB1]QUL79167.1 RelA/SpoT domain-containing protein [Brevibacterium sp. SMBL_HHYL_HB1]